MSFPSLTLVAAAALLLFGCSKGATSSLPPTNAPPVLAPVPDLAAAPAPAPAAAAQQQLTLTYFTMAG